MDHNCFRNDDSIYFYPRALARRMQSNAHALWKDTLSRNTLWTNTLHSTETLWGLNVFLSLHPGY